MTKHCSNKENNFSKLLEKNLFYFTLITKYKLCIVDLNLRDKLLLMAEGEGWRILRDTIKILPPTLPGDQ